MFAHRIQSLQSSLIREILAATQQPGMISFAGGLPATDLMPVVDWAAVPAAMSQYGASEGEWCLREAIAAHACQRGLQCSAEQVLILSGSQQGLDLVSKLFLDPGAPVLLESPTYLAASQCFRLFEAQLHGLPLGPSGPDPEQFAAMARALQPRLTYLIPSFQNPSGACYSAACRQAIARTVEELGLPLLEDDPYGELDYADQRPRPLCADLQQAPWIYQGSFSKTLLPGLRVGYLIAAPVLFPHLVRLKQAADLHTNRPGQWLAWQSLIDPQRPLRLQQLCRAYHARRDYFADALQTAFGDELLWQLPQGGLFFWARRADGLDSRPYLPAALAQGVAYMPGEAFFPEVEPQLGWLRLNFSHASGDAVATGMRRLRTALQMG